MKFSERLLRDRPDLVGRCVWFCVNRKQRLKCIINGDGTISTISSRDERFDTASELIAAISNGSIAVETGFKIPRKDALHKCSFAKQLYLRPNASLVIDRFIQNPLDPLPMEDEDFSSDLNDSATSDETRRSSSENSAHRSLPCPGFITNDSTIVALAPNLHSRSFFITDGIIRSRYCNGYIKRSQRLPAMCNSCQRGRDIVTDIVHRSRLKGAICPGLGEEFRETISKLELDSSRRQFSSVMASPGKTLRSKKCHYRKNTNKKTCSPCKKTRRVLRTLTAKLTSGRYSRYKRIIFSGHHLLSPSEQAEKTRLLVHKRKRALEEARKAAKKARMELSTYKPDDPIIRKAVVALKDSFEKSSAKLKEPRCRWTSEGSRCQSVTDAMSLPDLGEHVLHCHIRPQKQHYQEANVEPNKRRYSCSWDGCRRKPMTNYMVFVRHVMKEHVGNVEQLLALESAICSAINSNRKPNARRYTEAMKRLSANYYRSQSTWKRTRRASMLFPLPTVGTVLNYRSSIGEVREGIDYGLIAAFKEKALNKPEYHYGTLVFDEISIRKGFKFVSSNLNGFGFASDRVDEPRVLGEHVLVFQYMAIFSKPLENAQRFALDIAWYSCAGMTCEKLQEWFWAIVHTLDYYGFSILATVCDGAGVNRSFQDACLGKPRNEDQLWIPNLAHPGRKIFILSDPSHAIKKLRNSWASDRCLTRQNGWISWSFIENVRRWQSSQCSTSKRVDRRLTSRHVDKRSFNQMNVQRAVDVFSHSIENVMIQQAEDIGSLEDTRETRRFMKAGRQLWLTMNSKKTVNSLEAAQTIMDQLDEVAIYFDVWKEEIAQSVEEEMQRFADRTKDTRRSVLKRKRQALKKVRSLRFITMQCYEDVELICKGVPAFLEYVFSLHLGFPLCPRAITQDMLENDFSNLRSRAGSGMNPTVSDLAYSLKNINMNRLSLL